MARTYEFRGGILGHPPRLPKSRLTTVSIRHDGSFVRARDLYFSMAPNRAIPPQKTIRLSSLAAAQPWITLSRPEALNAVAPRVPASPLWATMSVVPRFVVMRVSGRRRGP